MMIKRKDGSVSQHGLWDSIRENKGSGKKPTKEMLKQEQKIMKEKKGMGFKAAATAISKKQGIPMKNASAILAAGARKASPAAKKANPNLKKVTKK